MLPMTMLLSLLTLPGVQSQAAPPDPQGSSVPSEEPKEARTATAEELRSRIHTMRMDLLLGGDRVRAAERQAVEFYGEKREFVEQRVDTLQADLSEKRAAYDVATRRALAAEGAVERRQALGEAGGLRAQITSLESEANELDERRGRLGALVAAVEARDRERQKLAAEIETSSDPTTDFGGVPFPGIGLAPATTPPAASDPLADDALIGDLLQRDPVAARRLIFDLDPKGYFDRFPLQPPASLLPRAIPFPVSDPPGRR